jgi:calcineurin-like phosphoesterase family protein
MEGIIQKHNEVVPQDAVVFDLGDYAFHDPEGHITMEGLKRMNFRTRYMLWGNHNSGLGLIYRRAVQDWFKALGCKKIPDKEIYPLKVNITPNKDVIFIGDLQTVMIRGQSHLPKEDDELTDEQLEKLKNGELELQIPKIILCHYAIRNWWHNAKGSWMLCGHSHGNDPGINMETGRGRIIDCGYESAGKPVSFTELYRLFRDRPIMVNETHREKDHN